MAYKRTYTVTHTYTHISLQIDLNQARATVKEDKTLILDYIVKGSAELEEGQDQLQFLSNTLKLFFILDPLDFKMDLQQAANLQEEGGWGAAQRQQQQQQQLGSSADPLFDLSAYSAWLSLEPGHDNYRCLAVYGGAGSGAGGLRREGWAVDGSNSHTRVVIRHVVIISQSWTGQNHNSHTQARMPPVIRHVLIISLYELL